MRIISFFLSVVYRTVQPVIRLSLKAEQATQAISWFFVRTALYAATRNRYSKLPVYRIIAKHFTADRMKLEMTTAMKREGIPLRSSITASLLLRHTYTGGLELPEHKLIKKPIGLKFASALGLKVPQTFLQGVRIEDIPHMTNVVIKPVDMYGAHGVFIIRSEQDIVKLIGGRQLGSWEEMQKLAEGMMRVGLIKENSWMVQEYVTDGKGNPARDLKLFVFYGRLALFAEIIRYPKIICDFRDLEGRVIENGLYGPTEMYTGPGITQEEVGLAEKTSLEVPAPFLRIDFLRGIDGPCFCEFTAIPGHMGLFNREVDHRLGMMFHEAEARLKADLLSGKKFEVFHRVTNSFR